MKIGILKKEVSGFSSLHFYEQNLAVEMFTKSLYAPVS